MLSFSVTLLACFVTLIRADFKAEWENVQLSVEPIDASTPEWPWPTDFNPKIYGFGKNNLVLTNDKYRARDNEPVHQIQRLYRGQAKYGTGRIYDLRIQMGEGFRYLALNEYWPRSFDDVMGVSELCSTTTSSPLYSTAQNGERGRGRCASDSIMLVGYQTPVWVVEKDGHLSAVVAGMSRNVIGEERERRSSWVSKDWMTESESTINWISDVDTADHEDRMFHTPIWGDKVQVRIMLKPM